RRRRRLRGHGRRPRRAPRHRPAGRVSRLRGDRLRTRGDGHRARVRRAPPARALRPCRRRYRPLGTERGLRLTGAILPGPPGHRFRADERQRRSNRARPPVRHERHPPRRSCPARGQAPRRPLRGGHHVRRRRHGRRRPVRSRVKAPSFRSHHGVLMGATKKKQRTTKKAATLRRKTAARPAPKNPRKALVRDRLLEKAAELFCTSGYARTSINDIADSLDLKRSSVYHYFKNKEEIIS